MTELTAPTMEQLVNFISVRIGSLTPGFAPSKTLIQAMLADRPELELLWRERHAEFQAEIDKLCKHCGGGGTVPTSAGEESCLRCRGTGRD